LPELSPELLQGAVVYQDGQFDDARYCLALVKTFSDAGGTPLNYLRVAGFEKDTGGMLATAVAEDALTGVPITIRAQVYINATGPYSDALRALANPQAQPRLVLSKGAHILLPLEHEGPALLIPRTADGRVIFAIPWMGRLLVGTTDELVDNRREISVTRNDVEYLLSYLNRYCRQIYSARDIVSAFAGVRPLVRSRSSRSTQDVIREHEVEVDPASGLISILGGKWTSYRAMAEDTIDVAGERLGKRGVCQTANRSLAGSHGYRPELAQQVALEGNLSEESSRHLVAKFGGEAREVLRLFSGRQELREPIVRGAASVRAEVIYCARYEMAVTVEDVLARRLGVQLFSWELAVQAAPVVASLLGSELNWPEEEQERSAAEYISKVQRQAAAVRGEPVVRSEGSMSGVNPGGTGPRIRRSEPISASECMGDGKKP
jgi:glycerol-3-phosphate dehydrogenase